MPEIGAFEAKTHLSRLLAQVEKGERFTITKHGRPVAELRPARQRAAEEMQEIVERMKAFQASHSLEGESIRDLIEDGRKY